MDYLWTPWRYRYVTQETQTDGCIFCEMSALAPAEDRKNLILYRAEHNFVLLNLYPYTAGHAMVAPYAHVGELTDADPATLSEMIGLAQKLQAALKAGYKPQGYNLGINIGRAAGAGVDGHLHLHVLPRWIGDSNFMTVSGETRVLPEDLHTTYEKLIPFFRS